MVNNQFMGTPQIPIEVAGHTYFGCCEMCKARLGNDPTARLAKDPVSGREVDKATAVIGKTREGHTLYFENERNFAAYSSSSGS
jgi:YHS domain-containing protein